MAEALSEDSIEFWRKKSSEQEEIIKTLSGHCIKGK